MTGGEDGVGEARLWEVTPDEPTDDALQSRTPPLPPARGHENTRPAEPEPPPRGRER